MGIRQVWRAFISLERTGVIIDDDDASLGTGLLLADVVSSFADLEAVMKVDR